MRRRFNLGRNVTAALLSGLMLAGTILPAGAAESPYQRMPAAPKASAVTQERSSDDNILLGIGVAVVGVALCAAFGCFSGDDEEAEANTGGATHHYRNSDDADDYVETEDTSSGCFWGDRAYGTCR